MEVTVIRSMFEYDAWAMEKVLAKCETISTAEFDAPADLPWGSMRDQFVHILHVHLRWLSWADGSLSGNDAYALTLDRTELPDVASVRSKWNGIQGQTERFLARATVSDMERLLSGGDGNFSFSIPVWKVLLQIAYHAMQHRTEIAMELTKLGKSPGDLDYIDFAFEEHATFA